MDYIDMISYLHYIHPWGTPKHNTWLRWTLHFLMWQHRLWFQIFSSSNVQPLLKMESKSLKDRIPVRTRMSSITLHTMNTRDSLKTQFRRIFHDKVSMRKIVKAYLIFIWITWSVTNDETNKEAVATAPPINTVSRIPILSTNIPAIGEQHNVDPNVREPINAKIRISQNNHFVLKCKNLYIFNLFSHCLYITNRLWMPRFDLLRLVSPFPILHKSLRRRCWSPLPNRCIESMSALSPKPKNGFKNIKNKLFMMATSKSSPLI